MATEAERYTKNPDFIYRKIVEEMVLVPIRQDVADMDCLYTLNAVGAFLWEKLDQPRSQAELQAAILEEYEVEPEVAAADLDRFLSDLTAIGALRQGQA